MKNYKLLTVATAVAASLSMSNAFANEFEFSGYARYGAHIKEGDNRYVQIGSTGAAVGRLGNEGNGGEFQLTRRFETERGVKWDIGIMLDHWSNDAWGSAGGINLKKAYASVSNVVANQPDMVFWGGRDFHQRPQQGLNDYFVMEHDGQGGGFKNLSLGGVNLDLGIIAQIDNGEGGNLGNDSGVYAITSKWHGIDVGIGALDLYANYGFASDDAPDKEDETSFQVGAILGLGSSNKLIARYSDGADNSSFDLSGDVQVFFASFEGSYNYGNPLAIDYLVSYKEFIGDDVDNKNEYSAIVRPMYSWNEDHSTWLEAGYAMVDYSSGGEEKGWKTTISQNISMGGMPWSRPMLRFYATVGDVENTQGIKTDTMSLGAMFEAWW